MRDVPQKRHGDAERRGIRIALSVCYHSDASCSPGTGYSGAVGLGGAGGPLPCRTLCLDPVTSLTLRQREGRGTLGVFASFIIHLQLHSLRECR